MSTAPQGGRVELSELSKWYGSQRVLEAISLTIEPGEFFSLLGPSGCGKTTTLRLIGGFEEADDGAVRIDGSDMCGVPPERRPVNTVFQSYALFPHRSVAENVAFGLRFTNATKAEQTRRVGEALELVRLVGFESRRPHQLSGGQQQRVALARSLVLRPKVLLLDEPLGALDAKLRRVLQLELRTLHQEVGITFVYVTHDQEEALTMSDRLAVMDHGRMVQVGAPAAVYDDPATAYVADFLGLANLVPAHAGPNEVELLGRRLRASTGDVRGRCTVLVRPERLRLVTEETTSAGGTADDAVAGIATHVVFAGPSTQIHIEVAGTRLLVVAPNDGSTTDIVPGRVVSVAVPPDALRVLADQPATASR
ncbi:MAG: ABC transporter ATP-binding protein [Ilumatobacteraceae bacterium]